MKSLSKSSWALSILFFSIQLLSSCGRGPDHASHLTDEVSDHSNPSYIHPLAHSQIIGSVPVSVYASELGYAGSSVQIDTLPVGNNFSPKVGITYSTSQIETGLAGVGWNLSGLSAISRCPSQVAFDGVAKAIEWSENDSFCLDGKKLLLIAGQPGRNGAEYRLYLEEQKRISMVEDHFEVLTKTGEKLFFGATPQSRDDGLNGKYFSYYLNKMLDRSGNAIEFTYDKSGGQVLLTKISYGGNDVFAKPHYRNVSFFYETRKTQIKRYVAGQEFQGAHLLKEIQIAGAEGLAWSYRLHHEQQDPAQLPLLVGIDQCFKDLACVSKTTFSYDVQSSLSMDEASSLLWSNFGPKNNPAWANNQSAKTFVDLNGDGYLDFLALKKDSISFSLSGPNGPGQVSTQLRNDLASWSPLVDMFSLADMNRDGYSDIVLFTQYGTSPGVWVAYWNGNGFDPLVNISKAFGDGWSIRNHVRQIVDVNNDGWPDVIGSRNDGIFVALNDQKGNLVGGIQPTAAYFTVAQGWINRNMPRYFLDINGDGLVDVVGFGEKNVEVSLGNGQGFLPPQVWSTEFSSSKYNPNSMIRQFADMNGDGLLDIVGMGFEGTDVALNTGKGFAPSERWLNNLGYNQGWDFQLKERFILDVNKDGFPDFVGMKKNGLEIYLGNGAPNPGQTAIKTKPFGDLLYSWDNKKDQIQIEDLDGNGKTDLFVSLNEGIWKAEFNTSPVRLSAVKTAMGEETKIYYKSLMDPSVYKQTKAKLPNLIPVSGSLQLVSEIKKSNGLGGYSSTNYRYENAFYHRDLFGFIGFEKRIVTDSGAAIETVETYSQDVSSLTQGALLKHEIYSLRNGRIPVSTVQSKFESKKMGLSDFHRALLERTSESEFFDERGNHSYSVSIAKEYDEYQNVVSVEASTSDHFGSYTSLVDSVYNNDVSSWTLGQLKEAKVTMSATLSPSRLTKTTRFSYDANGHLESEIQEPDSPLWIKKQFQRNRNSYGLVDTTVTSWGSEQGKGLGFAETVDRIDYDTRGFLEGTVNALGHSSTQIIFPETGLVQKSRDSNGLETVYTYDSSNRVSSIVQPDGKKTTVDRYLCDASCPSQAVFVEKLSTNGFGETLDYIDVLGRNVRSVTSSSGSQNVAQDSVYYENGLLKSVSKPYFLGNGPKFWTTIVYDDRNREQLITAADGGRREVVYDGLNTTLIDELGHKTLQEKDSRGLLQTITNAKGEVIKYSYFADGNLREVRDAGNNVTRMEYDIFGRRTNLIDPTTGLTTTAYNAFGLAATSNVQGLKTEKTYDALGRLLQKTAVLADKDPIQESFVYDTAQSGVGKLSQATGPNSSATYQYDDLSRIKDLTQVLLGKSYVNSTAYDSLGRVSRVTYPSAFAIDYVYDEISRVKEIRDQKSGKAFWKLKSVYPSGDVKEYSLGNGVSGFKSIDPTNDQIQSESIVGTDQTLQMSRSYIQDQAGNLKQRTDAITGLTEAFTYDPLDRLETFTGGSLKPVKMVYDELSRITERSDVGKYEYGQGCAGSSSSPFALNKVGTKAYCTDNRGNIVQSGDKVISFDANNLPTEIKDSHGSVGYAYGIGNAILSKSERIDGRETLTRYVGNSFEVEESSLGVKQRHYVGDFLIVETEGSDYSEHYLYKDYLGSTLAAADQSGSILERMDYDPFGQRRAVTDFSWLDGFKPKTTSRGFTGHDHIEGMNLIHMKGRVYDPTVGLFLSPDPYVQDPTLVQNLNRYSYVINNPLKYTDPSGHFFTDHIFKEIRKGVSSAGHALANPGAFLKNTWDKTSRATSDPRYLRLAASVAVSVYSTIYSPLTAEASWYQSAAYYAAVGYTSSYVATNGDQKAALTGAITGAAFNMVGSYFKAAEIDGQLSSGLAAAKVAAHGVVGGLSAQISGGRFESGLLSAGLSELAGQQGLYGDAAGKGWQIAQGAATAAVLGGSISMISGGSFEEGALNAAMGRLFNGVAHVGLIGTLPASSAIGDALSTLGGYAAAGGEYLGVALGGLAVPVILVGGVIWSSDIGPEPVTHSPDFIVAPNGTVFPVPAGAVGPVPTFNDSKKQTGSAFIGGKGGINGQVRDIRIMNPTEAKGKSPGYPNGYIKYQNGAMPKPQGVDPYTGKTLSNRDNHFSL